MTYLKSLSIKNFGNICEFNQTFKPHDVNIIEVYREEYEDIIFAIKNILSIYPDNESCVRSQKTGTAFGSHGEIVATVQRDDDVIRFEIKVEKVINGTTYYNYTISINGNAYNDNISRGLWDGLVNYVYPEPFRKTSVYRYSGKEELEIAFWPLFSEALQYEKDHATWSEKDHIIFYDLSALVPRDEIYHALLKHFIQQNSFTFADKGRDLVRYLETNADQRVLLSTKYCYGPYPFFIADIDDFLDDKSKMPQQATDMIFGESLLGVKEAKNQYILFKRKKDY